MLTSKKFISIFILSVFLFVFLAEFCSARELEIVYPQIPNAVRPTTVKTLLQDYIKYIFNFAIIISGIIAFVSLIYGGVRYLASAGNPSTMGDARGQMFAGILGLIILLLSYIMLTTINPQLVIMAPSIPVEWGIIIFASDGCSGDNKLITKDTPDLGGFQIQSLQFKVAAGTLDLEIYPGTNYSGTPQKIRSEDPGAQTCLDFNGSAVSIMFVWKLPGVYLVGDGREKFIPANTATLGDFNDKTQFVKFRNAQGSGLFDTIPDDAALYPSISCPEMVNGKWLCYYDKIFYGAVLHEHEDFKGTCKDYIGDSGVEIPVNLPNGEVSSVTLFTRSVEENGAGITFYEHEDYGGQSWGPKKRTRVSNVTNEGIPNDTVSSLKIDGDYMAILFDDVDFRGTCQVFFGNDPNLRDDPIGRCNCGPFSWGCKDCLSSFVIIPVKR